MPAPVNDSCATATVISSLDYLQSVNPAGATNDSTSDAPCGSGTSYGGLWWKWTGGGGVTRIAARAPATFAVHGVLSVFSGSCASLTHLGCTAWAESHTEVTIDVSNGVDYFFLVTSKTTPIASEYTLIVRDATPLANDDCSGATDASSLPYTQTKDTSPATADGPAISDGPCGSGQSYYGIWYKCTVPGGVTRLAGNVSDVENRGVLTAFSGSCGALVNMGCTNAGSSELFIDVTPASTYYFLVSNRYNFVNIITFTLRDATIPTEALNTLCVNVVCGPTLITGPQRRWNLHRFDIQPRTEERG